LKGGIGEWLMIGDGFNHFDLGEPLGRTAVGICMGEFLSALPVNQTAMLIYV
jgi:hypothetical protein